MLNSNRLEINRKYNAQKSKIIMLISIYRITIIVEIYKIKMIQIQVNKYAQPQMLINIGLILPVSLKPLISTRLNQIIMNTLIMREYIGHLIVNLKTIIYRVIMTLEGKIKKKTVL